MKVLLFIIVVALLIAAPLELIFDISPDIAMPCALGCEVITFIILFCIYTFTHWGKVRMRAFNMAEIREKRIMKENLETWNRDNRKFINAENRRTDRQIERMHDYEVQKKKQEFFTQYHHYPIDDF